MEFFELSIDDLPKIILFLRVLDIWNGLPHLVVERDLGDLVPTFSIFWILELRVLFAFIDI